MGACRTKSFCPAYMFFATTMLVAGCDPYRLQPCADSPPNFDTCAVSPKDPDALYISYENPYETGSMPIRTIELSHCDYGSPAEMRIYAPETPGSYAVVFFVSGLTVDNACYHTMLHHLASHGFVVVAPQSYVTGLHRAFGWPTSITEADDMMTIVDWLDRGLQLAVGGEIQVRTDRLGLAGQSQGGKVVWLMMALEPRRFRSVAGIDPNDSLAVLAFDNPPIARAAFDFNAPSLITGDNLESLCSFEGNNHKQFFANSPSPSWYVVVPGAGHLDMFEDYCTQGTAVCGMGPDLPAMRRFSGGVLAAFFRATLLDEPDGYDWISNTAAAPVEITVETK